MPITRFGPIAHPASIDAYHAASRSSDVAETGRSSHESDQTESSMHALGGLVLAIAALIVAAIVFTGGSGSTDGPAADFPESPVVEIERSARP
ncbi:MAG: hypothetical protein WBM90_09540 [Acidimicrobiia bacterium]